MKKLNINKNITGFCIAVVLFTQILFAQENSRTLTFQGVDNLSWHSASARAAGNTSIGLKKDIGAMFYNPATLQSIDKMQLSFGGLFFSKNTKQKQNYAPIRYYSNLSLLMEGLTGRIPNPDTTLFGFTAQDSVQRPYDDIGPNWSHTDDNTLPLQAMLAMPLISGNVKIVAGIGAIEYANLNHYYQNNNVLSPSILSQRPLPTFRPTDDNPVNVDWQQRIQARKGSIKGYGFALAGWFEKYNLSVGFSGLILRGSSDDFENVIGRGNLTFFSNAFRVDSISHRITKNGTSDFKGQEFTLSSVLNGRYVSIGFSLKLPATITRTYSQRVSATDTTGSIVNSEIKGEDELKLRWRGMIGLSLTPRENLRLGLEYEFRPYESVQYIAQDGQKSKPWLPASLFRVGIEYMYSPWLTMRGGMRGEAEVFEPEGNKIEGEPITYTVYSAGIGVCFSGVRLNITYENSLMKYQDIWSSAISKNRERTHTLVADLTYEIPWEW